MEKFTELEILEDAIEVWEWLLEHLDKEKWNYPDIRGIWEKYGEFNTCPLCRYYSCCAVCPLKSCEGATLYWDWFCGRNRKQAAEGILSKMKARLEQITALTVKMEISK